MSRAYPADTAYWEYNHEEDKAEELGSYRDYPDADHRA